MIDLDKDIRNPSTVLAYRRNNQGKIIDVKAMPITLGVEVKARSEEDFVFPMKILIQLFCQKIVWASEVE
ncbi:hypothetical protein GWO43_16535 [candidate division KSB1 bacterium]|nr:hypothetical protein [candidate division KSB1 bacterium]NIT72450.1 hypothetical protein [candidate division KSB1 bacterium]NIX72130.1 hypothetical protein [candidate division KSB1 bacterium]